VVALVCALLSAVLLRRGIGISPDGWFYWQASLSLLNGDGYADLYGQPVLEWPPGFSLYLAAWQRLFGVSGRTLVAAVVAAVASAGFLWTLFLHRVMEPARPQDTWLALVWLVCVLPAKHGFLLSEVLFHALLPGVLLIAQLAWSQQEPRRLLLASAALGTALGALTLVRNFALIFIPSLLLPLLLQGRAGWRWRLGSAALASTLALTAWYGTRVGLGLGASHEIGWGIGYLSAAEYAGHLLGGLANHLGQGPLGAALLAGISVALVAARPGRLGLSSARLEQVWRWGLVVSVACFLLFLLFNVARIGNPPRGRFTLFAVLIVVPLFLVLLNELPSRTAALALSLLLLFAPASRLQWLARRAVVPPSLVLDTRPVPRAIGHDVVLAPACIDGPQRIGNHWCIVPPTRAQLTAH